MTNRITYYDVAGNGSASAPDWRASAGGTPFGFEFTRGGTLIVSELQVPTEWQSKVVDGPRGDH